ncbi:MAG: hypothetical protein QOJ46_557, partial [bacterium]
MKAKAKKKAVKKVCRRVKIKGTKRYRKVCKPAKKKKVVKKQPVTTVVAPVAGAPVPVPSPAAPPVTTPPDPGPAPPADPPPADDPLVYSGPFGVREAQRLLWRA